MPNASENHGIRPRGLAPARCRQALAGYRDHCFFAERGGSIVFWLFVKNQEFSGFIGGICCNSPRFAATVVRHSDALKACARDDVSGERETNMANTFGTDILIQSPDPMNAASFYVEQLGFAITDETPNMISLHGGNINLFIERGPALGPVLEVTVGVVEEAKRRLVKNGCEIIKDEPDFPRCYVKDPFGLIYNLKS